MLMNVIVGLVILAIMTSAIVYIVSEKRKGVKCVGCPYAQGNKSNCSCNH